MKDIALFVFYPFSLWTEIIRCSSNYIYFVVFFPSFGLVLSFMKSIVLPILILTYCKCGRLYPLFLFYSILVYKPTLSIRIYCWCESVGLFVNLYAFNLVSTKESTFVDLTTGFVWLWQCFHKFTPVQDMTTPSFWSNDFVFSKKLMSRQRYRKRELHNIWGVFEVSN